MAIENIGNMRNILNSADTSKWTQSADFDSVEPKGIGIEKLGDLDLEAGEAGHRSFSDMLSSSIGDVNKLQKEADIAIQGLASGKNKNLHETMLAVEKADIAFKSMNQIRMKVVEAYKEVMRMQL